MPSEPVRNRLLSTGVPHCSSGNASSGSSATIADGIAAKPTGTLMKSSSDDARSHIRRCHVEATSSDSPPQCAADRRRSRSSRRRATTFSRNAARSAVYVAAASATSRSRRRLRRNASTAITIGPMIMISRKIQRPVIAANPTPVTSGSSARHHMPPLPDCEEPRSLGASTFGGSADLGRPGTAAGRPARRRRARRPRRCRRG